jgi:glycosyltransferase involved in cell wall biosynthesis
MVSCIMSTYNRADKFLADAINSVIAQQYKKWELIVVDDCSTDGTEKLVRSYMKDDVRIRYIKLDQNSGSDCKPKNVGVESSIGEYIAYIDDDCEWYPNHLQILVDAIEADKKNIDAVYCDFELVDPSGVNPVQRGIAMDFDPQFLFRRNYIDTNNVLHKTHLAFAVGGFDQSLPKFIDWNMWVRMVKWGAKFVRVPVIATKYKYHEGSKSNRVKTKSYRDPKTGMTMFEPTFNPSGCEIYLHYLRDNKCFYTEKYPNIAIYTITYDRVEYTREMWETLQESTMCPFDWYVWDNGSTDQTREFLSGALNNNGEMEVTYSPDNKGLTIASNALLDRIMSQNYQIVIKVDNDAKFLTKGWLDEIVELWKCNHMLYMSPYPEGLVANPGGAPRVGTAFIGDTLVEVTMHIGGFVAAVDARAYQDFRFSDQFLHGNQDSEASKAFRDLGYMPCYIPKHRVLHNDSTAGQVKKYPKYFERRKQEKTTTYKGGVK